MSRQTIKGLRRAYERFNETGRLPLSGFTDDFVQSTPNEGAGDVLHGRDAWAAQARDLTDTFDDLRVEVEDIFDLGERVLVFVRFRGRARSSGIPLDYPLAHVWTFRGDKVAAQQVYYRRAEALEAVGLTGVAETPQDW
jgi:ketosteroid isomerase-like protein